MNEEKKAWELLKLEDKLYSEGYSEKEIDSILRNEELKIRSYKRPRRLRRAVAIAGLSLIATIGSFYLFPQCNEPAVEKKADPQMYWEPLKYNEQDFIGEK